MRTSMCKCSYMRRLPVLYFRKGWPQKPYWALNWRCICHNFVIVNNFFHNWYFNNFIKKAYTTTLLQRIISNLLLQRINITMTCAPFLVERTASLVIAPCETDNKWFKISVTVTYRFEQCLGQQIDVFCNSISIPRDKISCNLVTFKWNK